MYYEICVSKLRDKGQYKDQYIHYFATAKRSLTSRSEARIVLAHFVQIFPAPMYFISISKQEEIGEGFDVQDFLENED